MSFSNYSMILYVLSNLLQVIFPTQGLNLHLLHWQDSLPLSHPCEKYKSIRLSSKESACSAGATGDASLIPGSGRSPGGGNGNPLQYSCRENPMDRAAWWAAFHQVAKSWTRLSMPARLGV